MQSEEIDARGLFWWGDESVPQGHYAPPNPAPGRLKIDLTGQINLELELPSTRSMRSGQFGAGFLENPIEVDIHGILAERNLPVFCIEVRQMKAFAKASPVKTDRRDARLIAQAMRTGLFKAAHVKTDQSQRIRLLLRHRRSMVRRNKDLINTVRGTLKAFGIRTGGGKNTLYARRVREAIDDPMLLTMTEPLLVAYEDGIRALATIDKIVTDIAGRHPFCRLLMTIPGVGPVTALTFRTGVDVPYRFDEFRLVAAVFGLTMLPAKQSRSDASQNAEMPWCGRCSTKPPTSC